jgi:hypothetical protein
MANPDRKGGGGLSLQTLVIASAASLTAAMVVSRLFPPGTIYASAVTPVIVAAVSEALHRPAARVTALREQRRTMVLSPGQDEPHPLEGAPAFARGDAAEEELTTNGTGAAPAVSMYRSAPPGWRSRIHPRLVIATGLAAFAIAVAVLTLPELIFGGAVATTHRTTFFGGGTSTKQSTQTTTTTTGTTTTTAPATVTQTVPAQTPAQATDTHTTTSTSTATTTTPTDTSTSTTGTSTTPTTPTP